MRRFIAWLALVILASCSTVSRPAVVTPREVVLAPSSSAEMPFTPTGAAHVRATPVKASPWLAAPASRRRMKAGRLMAARQVGIVVQDITQSYTVAGVLYPGADPFGTIDSSPAINHWVSTAGIEAVAPCGTYRIKSTIIVATGVLLRSASALCASLMADDSAGNIGTIVLIKDTYGVSVFDLVISSYTQRSAGIGIEIQGGDPTRGLNGSPNLVSSKTTLRDVDVHYQFGGIVVDNDTSLDLRNWMSYIQGAHVSQITNGGVGIWINTCPTGCAGKTGASHFIEDAWIDTPIASTALAAIRLTGSGDVTLTNNETWGPQYGVLMDPVSGGFLTSVTVTGGFYDQASIASVRIAPSATVKTFGAIVFSGVWMAGGGTDVLQIEGTKAQWITVADSTLYSALLGWGVRVTGASNLVFDNDQFLGNRTGGALFTGTSHDWDVRNSSFLRGIGTGCCDTGPEPIAVQIDNGDNYSVVNNTMHDVTTATAIVNTPGAASTRIVSPNRF